jgi:broad specificity phosphatase PhoE
MAAELILIRLGQASFGAADYDRLSDLGHRQSQALGAALVRLGIMPDAVCMGGLRRHRETWEGINTALGFDGAPQVLAGFDEFDFAGLLEAAYRGRVQPADLHSDRRAHFSALRDTVLEWQRGQIADPPETYDGFAARVAQARSRAMAGARRGACVLAITSGGPIGQSVAQIMQAPADAMIRLQLQVRNCSITRIIVTPRAAHVSTFNETPHIDGQNADQMLTYS